MILSYLKSSLEETKWHEMKLSSISITEKYFTEVVRTANKDRSTSLKYCLYLQ